MKVKELITELQKVDQELEVLRDAGEHDEHLEPIFGAEEVMSEEDGDWYPVDAEYEEGYKKSVRVW
jgi:hypothetical protein